ncbi:hypothetical protein ABIA43_007669 [Bradyrhizobium sp. USDA 328]
MARFGGLRSQQVGIDCGEFGQRSLHAADATGHAIDFIAQLEPPHLVPNLLDHAGEIDPGNCGQRMPRMRCRAGMDLGVERIDPARAHPDQHLARADFGRGDGREPQRRVVRLQHGCAHCRSFGHDCSAPLSPSNMPMNFCMESNDDVRSPCIIA